MSRKQPQKKVLPEHVTEPPATVWAQAVSRFSNEQEQGYDGLSLLLLLFESVLDLRANEEDQEQAEPWIAYRHKMNKPQGPLLDSFVTDRDQKLTHNKRRRRAA